MDPADDVEMYNDGPAVVAEEFDEAAETAQYEDTVQQLDPEEYDNNNVADNDYNTTENGNNTNEGSSNQAENPQDEPAVWQHTTNDWDRHIIEAIRDSDIWKFRRAILNEGGNLNEQLRETHRQYNRQSPRIEQPIYEGPSSVYMFCKRRVRPGFAGSYPGELVDGDTMLMIAIRNKRTVSN